MRDFIELAALDNYRLAGGPPLREFVHFSRVIRLWQTDPEQVAVAGMKPDTLYAEIEGEAEVTGWKMREVITTTPELR